MPLQPLAVKESVAGEFGLLLLLTAVALFLAGLAVGVAETRAVPTVRIQRRIGMVAVAAAVAVPLVLFTSVAFSNRGLGGTISERMHELTSETASTPGDASRLTAAGSSRGRYWREAGHVFAVRRATGTGAGTFGIARLHYRKDELVSLHAHGFVPQTLADLGLIGLVATLALLAAWLASAARTTGLVPRLRRRAEGIARRDWSPERVGVVAVTLVAVVFGLQSAIDWTWFVPGPAVMALASAGYVAGRGPLQPAAPVEAPASAAAGPDPVRVAGAIALAFTAVLCVWSIWQPEASERASNRALDLVDQHKYDEATTRSRRGR
jgi:hypothetical protein